MDTAQNINNGLIINVTELDEDMTQAAVIFLLIVKCILKMGSGDVAFFT